MASGRCEDNFDTRQSLHTLVKMFLFYVIDEIGGIGIETMVASGHIRQVLAQ